jgi:hypothetical protein
MAHPSTEMRHSLRQPQECSERAGRPGDEKFFVTFASSEIVFGDFLPPKRQMLLLIINEFN